jgi:hypothetical protein
MMALAEKLDTDPSNDRRISKPYHGDAGIHATARGNSHVGRRLRFDSILPFFNGQVDCATCHAPHDTSPGITTMLHQPLGGQALCLLCRGK